MTDTDFLNRIYLFDTTLRDGAQAKGVDFNLADKAMISRELNVLGIDYVEGGWPGANPTDDAFFAAPPCMDRSKLTAFGMTRRPGRSAENDPGLAAILSTEVECVVMVGKTWDYHVDVALEIDRDENVRMISESVRHASSKIEEVMFDAEHFFDGYKSNPKFAMKCLKAAVDNGARWVVLCDTNGGTLPHEVDEIVGNICREIPKSKVGVHFHNDTGNAVANSLSAVRVGAQQIQGTINGLGERCGNADLVSIIPTLMLKMGYQTNILKQDLPRLSQISRILDERLNRQSDPHAPYVGESAFAHKGGLHASAVVRDPKTYEHMEPHLVGNQRQIVVSDQSGRSNILSRLREIGVEIDAENPKVAGLVDLVKEHEFNCYAYDSAEASFELLARRMMGQIPNYFRCTHFRVIDERRWNSKSELVTLSEATVKLEVDGDLFMAVAEGNGPVNALDEAIRKVLVLKYPALKDLHLLDYKVRILTPADGTGAVTRVFIESADNSGNQWSTVGVSANIIDASYNALRDSINYKLFCDEANDSRV